MRKRDFRKTYIFFTGWLILLGVTGLYAVVWHYYNDLIMDPFHSVGNWLIYGLYLLFLMVLAKIYGGYQVGHLNAGNIIYSSLLCLLFVNVITYFQISLIGRELMPVLPMLMLTLVQAAAIVIWAIVANKLYTKLYPPRRMLLIYDGTYADSLVKNLRTRPEKYVIADAISISEGVEAVCAQMQHYDAVVICDVKSPYRNQLLKYCYGHSIRTYLTPKISDVIMRGAINVDLFDTPILLCPSAGLSPEQAFTKRAMDLCIAVPMTVVTAPIMLITAIIIKCQDGGPILFKQKRCTLNEKVFSVLKFRSMIVDAEKDGKAKPCVDNDPRVTPFGKFIRITRIDELPQLFNIIKGDMSIVGPRPERIEHVRAYNQKIPEFKFRSKVKAGLTGYAQIAGKYNTTPYDKLKMDLMYIEQYSLLTDLKLMLLTVKVLFMKESTKGFSQKDSRDMHKQDWSR